MIEKIEFKPNIGNFDLSLKEILSYVKIWQLREQDLKDYFLSFNLDDRLIQMKKYEELNQVKLKDIFQLDFENLSNPNYSYSPKDNILGNGAQVVADKPNQRILIKGDLRAYSGDFLMIGQMIEDYRLWQPGGYALWTKGQGKGRKINSFGWKNVAYRSWYKNSLKLE